MHIIILRHIIFTVLTVYSTNCINVILSHLSFDTCFKVTTFKALWLTLIDMQVSVDVSVVIYNLYGDHISRQVVLLHVEMYRLLQVK